MSSRASGHEPLGHVRDDPVGLPVAAVGVALITVLTPRLLPDREPAGESMRATARRFHVVMTVDGRRAARRRDHRRRPGCAASTACSSPPSSVAAAWSRLIPTSCSKPATSASSSATSAGCSTSSTSSASTSAEQSHLLDTERPGARLFEAVVSQQSTLVGQTLRDVGFRARYDAAVLAVHRATGTCPASSAPIELRPGDVLLLLASPGFESIWRNHSDFSLVASVNEPPPPRRRRAWLPTVALIAMVVTATVDILSLFEASMLAAAVVVVGGALSIGEARRAVNLNVVLTIAVSISLGAAVEASGLAAEIADAISNVGEPFGDVGLIVAVMVATMVLTELLSNNAAAALMLPVGLAIAATSGRRLTGVRGRRA